MSPITLPECFGSGDSLHIVARDEHDCGTCSVEPGCMRLSALEAENRELIVCHDKLARRLAKAETKLKASKDFVASMLEETEALNG